jgi:predicted nucleic acid-binding protein
MIADTSALLAFFDADEARHADVTAAIGQAAGPLIVSPYVLAELDYLTLTRKGVDAERLTLGELAGGAWLLAEFPAALLRRAAAVIERCADHKIGLADASLIVLGEDYGARRILTLDRRHFSVLRFADGTAPQILP